ncbi:MAG: amidohydrolase family protein [Proteobacteria bacterium]|nr:amidohydrolase family protein [Pseudomonadota bacterium]
MFDLVIRGGQVVSPHGVGDWDVAIAGGKIAALSAPGTFADKSAKRVIDARGKIVMPGGVDPHVHCLWPTPGPEGQGASFSEPPEVVSRAALHGGTTTIIDFAVWNRGETLEQTIARRNQDWFGKTYCDFAYHVMLQGKVPPETLGQLAEVIQEGYPSVKIFTTNVTPSRRGRMIDHGDIWEILKVTAKHGGIGAIHAEDEEIVMHMYEVLIREGRVGFENLAEVHNTLSEDLSFRRIIRLAENIEGAALYMMHVSAATGVEAIAASRAKDFPVYGETLHQYLLFSHHDYHRPHGQMYHTYPSLKERSDQDALWRGQLNGTINTIATDELCCNLSVKTRGKRIDDCTGGNSGCEPRLAIMYTEMVSKRGYGLPKFVDMVSSNAAKIMGLYPRKGAIAAGSDADITVLDPKQKRTVSSAHLHETDYTPWEGREVTAWPAMTILRGKVVVEDGQFLGDPRDGQYLKRRIPEEIRSRPAI